MKEPEVSVLMPTFKHAEFLPRALDSLLAQEVADWELIVIDDGSPDATAEVVAPYLSDERIRYIRFETNLGLGSALNAGTSEARGARIAYLPSDDVYYRDHLASLCDALDGDDGAYLAYSGVRWGHEPGADCSGEMAPEGIVLVQVMHRNARRDGIVWPTRDELVSDTIERDHWAALERSGARFRYTGRVTCEWVDHPDQRHKIIAGLERLHSGLWGRAGRGLSGYRQHYGVGRGTWLNWAASSGMAVDERARYAGLREPAAPSPDGLRILLVGELGFNPERVMALREQGHRLAAVWSPWPEAWDTVGPLPFGDIEDITLEPGWEDRARRFQPDVVYGLLNWQALPVVRRVLDAALPAPVVFHFKEGPFFAQMVGAWPTLVSVLRDSDGLVFINEESRSWFELALGHPFPDETTLLLDGDLPKRLAVEEVWTPKLSDADGEPHTACVGRPYGLEHVPFADIAAAGVHVHLYGEHFHRWSEEWVSSGVATGYLHLHPTVYPSRWVEELSRYDAGWLHVFDSRNGGDLRAAVWDDLNLPARAPTYAVAGLPWILKDNTGSVVAAQEAGRRYDVAVPYEDMGGLGAALRDVPRMRELGANMRAARDEFTFDAHVDRLVALFRAVIASFDPGRGKASGPRRRDLAPWRVGGMA